MTIEGIYYFGDQLRWNLGWPNPNPAGAFVAMCLMFLLLGQLCFRKGASRYQLLIGLVFFAMESGLWFLLCKTYSRGALLAAVCGLVFYFGCLCCFRVYQLSRRRVICGLLIRCLLLGSLLWGTGFFGRIDPGFVAEDASVNNRKVLWSGGVEMIWHKPIQGWGVGESGRQFMHWFQPVDATAKYAGMVNSYLHIGVERGLPFLLACVFVLLSFLCVAMGQYLRKPPERRQWLSVSVLTMGAVLVVCLVANIFNTLWIFPSLWVPVALSVVWIVASCFFGANCVSLFKWALISAGVLTFFLGGGLLLLGRSLSSQSSDLIQFEDDVVLLRKQASGEALQSQWVLCLDDRVFGEDWGKEARRLRRALETASLEIVILPIQVGEDVFPEGWVHALRLDAGPALERTLITSGGILPPSQLIAEVEKVVWLHPYGREDRNPLMGGVRGQLVFPLIDFSGQQARWKRFGREKNWEILRSGSLSEDIRSVWPGCLLQ